MSASTSTMSGDTTATRAEALFASKLQPSHKPTTEEVWKAIEGTIGDAASCAVNMADEFGEHPDLAVARMRWCLAMVHAAEAKAEAEARASRSRSLAAVLAYLEA